MLHFKFTKCVNWVLLASLITWTCGCTTTIALKEIHTCNAREITVTSHGGAQYRLLTWQTDTADNITGKGAVALEGNQFGTDYRPFNGTLIADSIHTVTYDNPAKTARLILGCTGVALVIAAIIEFNKPWGPTFPQGSIRF